MRYATVILLLAAALVGADRIRAADPPRLADALALQEAVEHVIAEAEPSVACILVSRSDLYQRKYGLGISPETPGKLGPFNKDSRIHDLLQLKTPFKDLTEEQKLELQEILSLSLHHPEHIPESYGSGVVLSESGLILTCAHVIRNATRVYVSLPGQRGSYADIHAADPRSDLAVLKLQDPPANLKPIKRGDGGKVRKGQFVVLVANPFAAGFRDGSPSASWGIISNLRRRAPGGQVSEIDRKRLTLHQLGTLIQTDTRINLGSSGGALLNLQGEMIGLTSAVAALTGVDTPGGFAIPLDGNLKTIIAVLERGQEVEYGFLGVQVGSNSLPGTPVQIQGTVDGSPAQKAGLQAGDYIVSIAGVPIRDSDDLFLNIGIHLAGGTIRLEAQATNGPRRTLMPKLAKYYVPGPVIAANRPAAPCGLRVDYTSILSQQPRPGRPHIPPGVVIREVVPNSSADKVQLQADKIITRVNEQPVTTPNEFYAAMENARGPIELQIQDIEGRVERITLENR